MQRREDRSPADLSKADAVACSLWWDDTRPSWIVSRAVSKWLELNDFRVDSLPDHEDRVAWFTAEVIRHRFAHGQKRDRQP